jgi:Sortase domain
VRAARDAGIAALLVALIAPAAARWSSTADAPGGAEVARSAVAAASAVRIGRPTRVRIPAIGVVASIEPLGLRPDGRLAAPGDPDVVGWWGGGPRPGYRGAAVLAGHVDSRHGPAVFARLRELSGGELVEVSDARGRRARFRVSRSETHSKQRFPTRRVYAVGGPPVLRLITCTGAFDRSRGHYEDNLVVSARRIGSRP